MKITIKNIIIYLLGLMIVAVGIAIMKRTYLGMGAWDAVNYSLSQLINIHLGQASMIVSLFMLLFTIIYNKGFKYLLVIIQIILIGLFIDLFDLYVFKNVVFTRMLIQIIFLLFSIFFLPFGLALVIKSTLPKGIFDEVTFSLMKIFKTSNFGIVRLFYELFGLLLALVLGYFAKIGIGQIGFGTLLVSVSVGPLINLYLNMLNKKEVSNQI